MKFRPVDRWLRDGDTENINGTSESKWVGFAEGFYFGDAAFVCRDIAGYAFPDELGLDAEGRAGKLGVAARASAAAHTCARRQYVLLSPVVVVDVATEENVHLARV